MVHIFCCGVSGGLETKDLTLWNMFSWTTLGDTIHTFSQLSDISNTCDTPYPILNVIYAYA